MLPEMLQKRRLLAPRLVEIGRGATGEVSSQSVSLRQMRQCLTRVYIDSTQCIVLPARGAVLRSRPGAASVSLRARQRPCLLYLGSIRVCLAEWCTPIIFNKKLGSLLRYSSRRCCVVVADAESHHVPLQVRYR
jgi:hypothetical protein